jgi:hypothetical protein
VFSSVPASFALSGADQAPDSSLMMTIIEELSANPRGINNDELKLAREYIIAEFEKFGLDVTLQEFTTENYDWDAYDPEWWDQFDEKDWEEPDFWENLKMPWITEFEAVNIIATIKPNTTVKTNDILIISAHYDSVDDVPGANDNASGMAVMLELARLLTGVPTDTELRFVAFDVEEMGLIGSMYYVESLINDDEIDNVIGVLNFDMLAGERERNVKIYTVDGEQNYMFDILKGREGFAPVKLSHMSMGGSDHMSFFPALVPGLMFSHEIIWDELHNENDTVENIRPDMLKYAAEAGLAIINKIISEQTPSYKGVSRPKPDNTIYQIANNARIPIYESRSIFEQETGAKLVQVMSDNLHNVQYQAKVKMLGMPEILTLTAFSSYWGPHISRYSVNMQEAGIPFSRLNRDRKSVV